MPVSASQRLVPEGCLLRLLTTVLPTDLTFTYVATELRQLETVINGTVQTLLVSTAKATWRIEFFGY
jgi:hypothetical protein